MGGSGRQSLTKLAGHIMEFTIISIEITKTYALTEWRDDIKRVMKNAGAKCNYLCFLKIISLSRISLSFFASVFLQFFFFI